MKEWWRRVRPGFLANIIYPLARLIQFTLRLRVVGFEKIRDLDGPKILCCWHGRTFVPSRLYKGKGLYAMFSHSRDGEMQAKIFTKFGFKVIRGSTGRGGERALVESIRALKAGGTIAMTPDGPRGPTRKVQEGVMLMAKKSGAPLVPVGAFARPGKLFNSWDRYLIPYPFAKASIVFGDAIPVPPNPSEEEYEAIRLKMEQEIDRMQSEAERLVGAR